MRKNLPAKYANNTKKRRKIIFCDFNTKLYEKKRFV